MLTLRPSALIGLLPLGLAACADTIVYKINNVTITVEDTGESGPDPYAHLPVAPTESAETLPLDVFGQDGNAWWINVSEATLSTLNQPWAGSSTDYVEYEPETVSGTENLLVVTPDGQAADFGRVGVSLPTMFTSGPWTPSTIPTFFFLDADPFVEGQRFGGVERVALDSTGKLSMFGAPSALEVFRAAGVPAARTAYVWVGGSGWENDTLLIPMVVREVYSGDFCEDNAAALGGGCKSVREFNGELSRATSSDTTICHHGDCSDVQRLTDFTDVVKTHFGKQSFDEATEPYVDWPLFLRSACVHWLLWIGDDYIHQSYNVVLVEGDDGRLRLLPMPMTAMADFAAPGTYTNTPLFGMARLSQGCEQDDSCHEAQLDTCEEVINSFEAMDPVSLIDDLADRLRAAQAPWGESPDGLWREPDDAAYAHYRSFFETRVEAARAELEGMRAQR